MDDDRIQPPVEDVIPAVSSELQRLGVTATFKYRRTPLNNNGNPVDGGTGELVLELPRALPVTAKFSARGITARVVELVTHRIESGDAAFDDAIHVSSSTREETTALLGNAELRRLLAADVTAGRPWEIDGAKAVLRFPGYTPDPGTRAIAVLEALFQAAAGMSETAKPA
jgi:hypothetical protein